MGALSLPLFLENPNQHSIPTESIYSGKLSRPSRAMKPQTYLNNPLVVLIQINDS